MSKEEHRRVYTGDLIFVRYYKWLYENWFDKLSANEIKFLLLIASKSYLLRKKRAPISRSEFNMAKATVSKIQANLKEKGLIEYNNTFIKGKQSLNMYKLIIPKEVEELLVFKEDEEENFVEDLWSEEDRKGTNEKIMQNLFGA
jgi:hypothetical protein